MNRKAFICLVFICSATLVYSQNWLADMNNTSSDNKAYDTNFIEDDSFMLSSSTLAIYPNPITDYFDFNGSFKPIKIYIFDSQGRLMYRSHSEYEKVSLAFLKSGKYILMARNSEGVIKTIQFLKQ